MRFTLNLLNFKNTVPAESASFGRFSVRLGKYGIDCFKDICYTDSKDETGAYGQWNISIKKPLQRN